MNYLNIIRQRNADYDTVKKIIYFSVSNRLPDLKVGDTVMSRWPELEGW